MLLQFKKYNKISNSKSQKPRKCEDQSPGLRGHRDEEIILQ